jgi:hypothetical protein
MAHTFPSVNIGALFMDNKDKNSVTVASPKTAVTPE